jgi:mono/diheme cytochrome c family protein
MKTLLAFIGLLAIVCVIAATVFFFAGFYNVAATSEDPALLNWALVNVRQASITRHATETPPMSLDDATVVQAGARAFSERGCINCHGAPGVNWAKFSEGLHPDPPDLKEIVEERRPQDLFWVVKNGIHMTGMPSFGLAEVPDREIWTIVAFLKKLPSVSEEDFKTWSARLDGDHAPSVQQALTARPGGGLAAILRPAVRPIASVLHQRYSRSPTKVIE